MRVHLAVMFDSVTEEDTEELRDAALELTDDRQSVRVFPQSGAPRWLIADFTMPTQPQYAAVALDDSNLTFQSLNRIDSAIGFPKDQSRARKRGGKKKGGRTI